jgi:hypothetical protein
MSLTLTLGRCFEERTSRSELLLLIVPASALYPKYAEDLDMVMKVMNELMDEEEEEE